MQLQHVEKSFGPVRALSPVSLELQPGEVIGLVGENGAGKSTLIKLLCGVYLPDGGNILWKNKHVQFRSPGDALSAGIATIHQELEYFGHLTVGENVLMGERWPRYRWQGVNWPALHSEAGRRLRACGIDTSPQAFAADLTAAQLQEVAIATALSRDAQLLILDEPTASLTEPEVERLFDHLRRLRAQGVTVLYVSHRLDEIFNITDRVIVLRDGQLVNIHKTEGLSPTQLVHDMVGRPLEQVYAHSHERKTGKPMLELDRISRSEMFQDVSFSIHAGEIVGLAGLVGAGRSELARAIYGLYGVDGGTMRLLDQPWKPRGPWQSLNRGLVYLPEERKRQGLVLNHSVEKSLTIGFSDLLAKWGLIPPRLERNRVTNAVAKYDIRAANSRQPIGTLSGGNQQKTMLGRWLERNPQVVLLDEPTRGVDIGAKAEIHGLIDQLAAQGNALLLISSDLPEILRMSDRILVMNRGRIGVELTGSEMTEENIILASSDLKGDAEKPKSRATEPKSGR